MPRSLLQLLVPEATDIGGTQPFQVTSVLFGNPGDGRVFSPRNSCGKWFEAGATYLVHAIRIEDGEPFMERPEVPLVTHSCLVGDRLRPADPGASITRLGIGASIVGLAGLGLWLLLRPTREGPVQS